MPSLTADEARYFRDQFREARALAQQDSEAFHGLLFALEQLGSILPHKRKKQGLGAYKGSLGALAGLSPLADVPDRWISFHSRFPVLYELVRVARNDAMHQGAFARQLTAHAIELSLVLENAMTTFLSPTAGDYMVREPTCAALWQPMSFVRRSMLLGSFSYLPLLDSRGSTPRWTLLSDRAVAFYLRSGDYEERLADSVLEALKSDQLTLLSARTVRTVTPISEILDQHEPVLVLSDDDQHLLGILTPFDAL
jgi:hypothetical protein